MRYLEKPIKSIKKTLCRRKHKDRKHRELSLRNVELKTLITELKSNIDAVKRNISCIEEGKDLVKL